MGKRRSNPSGQAGLQDETDCDTPTSRLPFRVSFLAATHFDFSIFFPPLQRLREFSCIRYSITLKDGKVYSHVRIITSETFANQSTEVCLW